MDALTEIEPVSQSRVRVTSLIVASALFMQNLDATIVTTALPAMAKTFHAEPLHMSVALTSYLISLSVFIPASGWVADHFGSRRVFRAAIVVFTIGSVLCGLSTSLLFLVLSRIVQGLGGAMMLPVGRLVVLRTVSKQQLVGAMAWLTMPALIGPVLGPPLGGFLVTYASWRWVFDINVPIGIIGVVAVTMFIPEVREPDGGGALDLKGLLLSGFAMALLMAGLETLGRGLVPVGWTIGAFVCGTAAVLVYVRHAKHHPHPVLDFSLMRLPNFGVAVAAGSLYRVAIGAMPFLLPLMLQLGFGYSALQSGLTTFVAAVGAIVVKPVAQAVLREFGFRNTLIWNGLASSISLLLFAVFTPTWPLVPIYGFLLIGGCFRSVQFTAFNTIVYGDVPRARMSAATGLYATTQQLTLTLGIVIGASSLYLSTGINHHATATVGDYHVAFLIVGLLSLLAVPMCARLSRTAGDDMTGHKTET